MRPVRPTPGTDNERLLDALLDAFPNPVWSPNSRLNLTAHSRAAELRKLGWEIDAVRKRGGGRKGIHGYQLVALPVEGAA